MRDSSNTEDQEWLSGEQDRIRARLQKSLATSDQLALVRELTRLRGGRMTISAETESMSKLHRGQLGRFGLAITPDGTAFMLQSTSSLEGIDGSLPLNIRVDPRVRSSGQPHAPDAFLLRLSPHAGYKSTFQQAAARAVVTMPPGAAMLAAMPTGSGKSLLFQLLAMRAREQDPHATIAVIVPTIALALDHERTARGYLGLEGSRAMPAAEAKAEREAVRDAFRRGEVPILFLSPETALGYLHQDLLEAAKPPGAASLLVPYKLAAFVIDEAHIIEQWGRKFRPVFQQLSGLVDELRARSPGLWTLLLSATLPPSARSMLLNDYLEGRESLELNASLPRYEFDLFARDYGSTSDRDQAVIELVDVLPRPAIVYTTAVADAVHLHQRLKAERGYVRIGLVTGSVTDAARQALVNAWSRDEIDLMVATSAFGMGVDKADVRAVVHACLPESTSRYYQEIGRAARDGHQAFAFCLWTREPQQRNDRDMAYGLASRSWLTLDKAMKRWGAILRDTAPTEIITDRKSYTRVMPVRLHSHHDEIDRGETDHNKDWNKALVVLLQRAKALKVLSGSRDDDADKALHWNVEILDEELLKPPSADAQLWRRFAEVRDGEQREAVADCNLLTGLLRNAKAGCLLTGVFEAIDPEAASMPPCGRCPSCRRNALAAPPPREGDSSEECWPRISGTWTTRDPPGLHVVTYTGLMRPDIWLEPMAAAGVQQFFVNREEARQVAARLDALRVSLGLVTEWDPDDRGIELGIADLPSAFVPPATSRPGAWFDTVRKCQERLRSHPQYLIVRDGLKLDGRPLGQIASVHPPRTISDFLKGPDNLEAGAVVA